MVAHVPAPILTVLAEGDAPNDIRDRAIGEANAENVQQLLYSLALYPMTQLQGFVIQPNPS